MKFRVTLLLEDVPYRALRVMAATENTSMSAIVEEYVMGERRSVTDPKEIKQIEEEHDVEPDERNEETFKFDKNGNLTKV